MLLALTLGACGGGGGGDPAPPEPPVAVPPLGAQCLTGSVARLAVDASVRQGRNGELALLSCSGAALSNVRWTQTAGAALVPLSARSQAISVEPGAAGAYAFNVAYSDAQGRSYTAAVPLTVDANADALRVVVRGEPSVYGGGQLSLRAWAPGFGEADLAQATVRWSRLDGPTADLGDTTSWRLIFRAPTVATDTILKLGATITLPDGRTAGGQFNVLVQATPTSIGDPLFGASDPASRVYAYRASGHAAALEDCIYNARLSRSNPNNLCTLGRLPLLGQATLGAVPTVDQVMDRVLVSNDWMGEVFERFLREQDPHGDFRRMLGSVTAIVIGGRVRPAFYWSATGAIYLDAGYLWLTPEQRDTISEAPDPRSNNGALLNFATPWRYVKDNRHAVTSYPVVQRQTRPIAELGHDLGRLLYHELTHAADFLPPRVHAGLPSNLRVYEAVPSTTASQLLFERLPFFSSEMQGLARVLSYGDAPTATQIAYRPADITAFFSRDRVNDDYSYSVATGATFSREDAAMLVEEGLMQLRYGVLRDFGVTNKLLPDANSADLLVDWGQRGRIGDAAIKPRLQLVLSEVMPWVPANAVDQLAPPRQLRAGQTWGANLDQGALAANRVRPLTPQERYNEQEQTTRELRRRQ